MLPSGPSIECIFILISLWCILNIINRSRINFNKYHCTNFPLFDIGLLLANELSWTNAALAESCKIMLQKKSVEISSSYSIGMGVRRIILNNGVVYH